MKYHYSHYLYVCVPQPSTVHSSESKSGYYHSSQIIGTIIMPLCYHRHHSAVGGGNKGVEILNLFMAKMTLFCQEAFTHGNTSTICERKISYNMSPILRATLWPNYWSHRVLLGVKWKVWTLSFHWYPLAFCRFSSLNTTASQSWSFFQKY